MGKGTAKTPQKKGETSTRLCSPAFLRRAPFSGVSHLHTYIHKVSSLAAPFYCLFLLLEARALTSIFEPNAEKPIGFMSRQCQSMLQTDA